MPSRQSVDSLPGAAARRGWTVSINGAAPVQIGAVRFQRRQLDALEKLPAFVRQHGATLARLQHDVEAVEAALTSRARRRWLKAPQAAATLDELSLDELSLLVEVEIEADTQGWKLLRQLRAHLERAGLSPAQAADRIATMAGDERAASNVSARDAAIARAVEQHGRDTVRAALRLKPVELRKAISRSRASRMK